MAAGIASGEAFRPSSGGLPAGGKHAGVKFTHETIGSHLGTPEGGDPYASLFFKARVW